MRILLVENDEAGASPVHRVLQESGHEVSHVRPADDALLLAASCSWELVVIGHSGGAMNTLAIVRIMRRGGIGTPILLLGTSEEAQHGRAADADNALANDPSAQGLGDHVANLGIRPWSARPERLLCLGDLELDLLTHCVKRRDRILSLRPREFQLLEFLVRNAGIVLDRPTLLKQVWDYHFDPRTNLVESNMCRLRAKIDRGFDVRLIHTIRGVGYRMGEVI